MAGFFSLVHLTWNDPIAVTDINLDHDTFAEFLNLLCVLCFSWFGHFYVFASVYSASALIVTCGIYFQSWQLSPWLVNLLDLFASSNRKARGKKFFLLWASDKLCIILKEVKVNLSLCPCWRYS